MKPHRLIMPITELGNGMPMIFSSVRPDSLAAERQAEALETAIVERRRIELERYASVGSFPRLGVDPRWCLRRH